MKLLYATILSLATLTLFSCKKDKRDLKEPQPLILKPTHNGGRLSDETLNQVKMYYYITLTSTHKEPVGDFGRASGTGYQQGLLSTSDVAELSAGEDIKFFYLSFPDGTVDTLRIDYESISEDDARENPCFCIAPQRSVSVNGAPAFITGYTVDSIPIYQIIK